MRTCHPLAWILLISFTVSAESDRRPNVLIVLADDQSYRDFGFMGNPLVHTPNLDRLAAVSARFPSAYVPMSVCRPSLATLLTGLYPHQHGIHFNHPPPGLSVMRRTMTGAQYRRARSATDPLIREVSTLPRILARHGYACLQTGKHWEGDFRLAGFTHGMTQGQPAERVSPITGTRLQDNGDAVAHGNGDAGLVIGRETMQPIVEFLDQYAGKQPFFIWYAPFLPHTPFDAPPRFYQLYNGKQIPAHLLPYYAQIARFDETVGQLMDGLSQRGVLDETLIVFISDNGFRPDRERPERQGPRSKLSVYEDGLRTPLLLSLGDVTVPQTHSALVHAVDVVPTVLAAVGLEREVTPRMKGVNLMPVVRGEQPPPERPVFGAIYPNDAESLGAPSRHVRGRWIRWQQYKLIVPGTAHDPLPRALYDLETDPSERHDLSQSAEHAATLSKMIDWLDRWWPANHDRDVTGRSLHRPTE